MAESNGSLPLGLWLTSPAGWLPRTGISSGTLRSVIEYGLPLISWGLVTSNRKTSDFSAVCCCPRWVRFTRGLCRSVISDLLLPGESLWASTLQLSPVPGRPWADVMKHDVIRKTGSTQHRNADREGPCHSHRVDRKFGGVYLIACLGREICMPTDIWVQTDTDASQSQTLTPNTACVQRHPCTEITKFGCYGNILWGI